MEEVMSACLEKRRTWGHHSCHHYDPHFLSLVEAISGWCQGSPAAEKAHPHRTSAAHTTDNVGPLKMAFMPQLCLPWPSVSAGDWLGTSCIIFNVNTKGREAIKISQLVKVLKTKSNPWDPQMEAENWLMQVAHCGSECWDRNDIAQTRSLYSYHWLSQL